MGDFVCFQLEELLQEDIEEVTGPVPSAPVVAPEPAPAPAPTAPVAAAPAPKPQPAASTTSKAPAQAAIKSKNDDYDDVSTWL